MFHPNQLQQALPSGYSSLSFNVQYSLPHITSQQRQSLCHLYLTIKYRYECTQKKTSKYKPIFEQIHAGRMDLREEMKKASLFDKLEMGRNIGTHDLIIKNSRLEAGNIEGKLERIEKAILEQKTEVNFDENGLHIIASKVQFKNNRIKKESR